jgi:hypothetical protein
MLNVEIYQTLENRGNDYEVEKHGPYLCKEYNSNGSKKQGIKAPWLGEGYYFWDTRMTDAQWWGDTVYKQNGYIICKTTYDQHSSLLYDLVGVTKLFDDFVACAEYIKKQRGLPKITFSVVLAYLKEHTHFAYKAIRVYPFPLKYKETGVVFPKEKVILSKAEKIQICFFDKTLLVEPYRIVAKKVCIKDQTI